MPSVKLRPCRTEQRDPALAADDLMNQIGSVSPKLVTLFASRDRDHLALNRALRERLPKSTRLVGASTGGEIDNDGMHAGSVVLGAFSGDFEVGLGLGKNLSTDALTAGMDSVTQACRELGVAPADLHPKRHVGLVIDDGFRYKKEELLLGMLEPNPGLVLVGGGACDSEMDPAKQSAVIHVDGEVVTDAVLSAIFETDASWAALRTHWYVPTGQTLKITRVDSTCKRALEIDGKPAAQRYADILGVGVDDLEFGKPLGFAVRPTALRVGREYFIRAPWKPLEDGSILFANLLEEGTELELMKIGDVMAMSRRFFTEELAARVGTPEAALLFNCSGRKWFSDALGKTNEIAETFRTAPPCAGFIVYFELYCGFHINTTLTALVFGKRS
ncbi:MAG: hypothetical protein JWM74_1059 [Myxococcaceae bacterium]|nr:hypothetical protein [Myxococcaceae bacterium]